MRFVDTIRNYIQCHHLMRREGTYLLGLSGGPDSVALLRALLGLGYKVVAVHCNFHLRGAESNRDEAFCKALCQSLGVKLFTKDFHTTEYARCRKVSIEMAAREQRYAYFDQLRAEIHADGICVAHHSDDQAETLMLNLMRGTGLKGLTGMKPRNGYVLRPLLNVARKEILGYLKGLGQPYVIDHTNLEDGAVRNKIRLNIFPQLEAINPNFRQSLLRMADNLREAETVVNAYLTGEKQAAELPGGGYDMSHITRSPSPAYLLWNIVSPYGFNRAQATEMASWRDGGTKHWEAEGQVAIISHGILYIIPRAEWDKDVDTVHITQTGIYETADGDRFAVSVTDIGSPFAVSHDPGKATVDADKVAFPVLVRGVMPSDRFVPFGLKGSKTVAKYLRDQKLSPLQVKRQRALVTKSGDIVWLVGRGVAQPYAVTEETKRVLVVYFNP